MYRIFSLLRVFIVFSFIIISTSLAYAESGLNKSAARGRYNSEFYLEWNNWYKSIVEKPIYLQVNDVFIGKLTLSRDNRLEISTPVSDNLMTRFTIGDRGVTILPDTGSYNIGLGITKHMHNGLSFDTSVNFDIRNPSDVTYWLTLPAIRF